MIGLPNTFLAVFATKGPFKIFEKFSRRSLQRISIKNVRPISMLMVSIASIEKIVIDVHKGLPSPTLSGGSSKKMV